MKTTAFDSPLRSGQFVRTSDGFTVRILGRPRRVFGERRVLVEVLKSRPEYKHLVGQQFFWAHHSPHSFAQSQITHINAIPIEDWKVKEVCCSHTAAQRKR